MIYLTIEQVRLLIISKIINSIQFCSRILKKTSIADNKFNKI